MLHDRETEPRAAGRAGVVGAIEPLEEPGQVRLAHSGPVVGDDEHRPGGFERRDDRTAARAGVADRVRDQVLGTTRSMRGRSGTSTRARAETRRDLGMLGTLGERAHDLLDHGQRPRASERDDFAARLELAEEEDVVDQVTCLLDLLARLLDEGVDVRTGKRGALEQDEHPRERRPQLVRDRRREARAELLVGRQLGERSEEEHESAEARRRAPRPPPARLAVPERGCGSRACSDETPSRCRGRRRSRRARNELRDPFLDSPLLHQSFTLRPADRLSVR